jgi:hypothetical protein
MIPSKLGKALPMALGQSGGDFIPVAHHEP